MASLLHALVTSVNALPIVFSSPIQASLCPQRLHFNHHFSLISNRRWILLAGGGVLGACSHEPKGGKRAKKNTAKNLIIPYLKGKEKKRGNKTQQRIRPPTILQLPSAAGQRISRDQSH
jgi:hypothetical protein